MAKRKNTRTKKHTSRKGRTFLHMLFVALIACASVWAGVRFAAEIVDMCDVVSTAFTPTTVRVSVPKFLTPDAK